MLQFSKWPHHLSNAGSISKKKMRIKNVHCTRILFNFRFYHPFTCTPNRKFNLKQGRVQIPEKFKLVALWYKYMNPAKLPFRLLSIKYKLWGIEINKYEK